MKTTGIKPRIFFIFSLITIILLSIMARIGYQTARQSYEQQSIAHTELLCRLLAEKLEVRYLDYIQASTANYAYNYFQQILKRQVKAMDLTEAFIFDSSLTIHVGANNFISSSDLAINNLEISSLQLGEYAATLPFKAEDGNWYLWAFYRLSPEWYVGIQESAERMSALDHLTYTFLLIGIIGVILTFIAAVFVAHSITRPVDRLVTFSARIGEGFFEDTPPLQLKDELQTLQNALVKMRDALKDKQDEKEQMLAQIAHEIRNPLGGIELIAGLLREDLQDNQKQKEYLDKILGEVRILKTQINDFLNYARHAQANPEEVSLDDLSREIAISFKNQLDEKKINLNTNFEETTIRFDPQHLKQILLNLVSNSIDAVDRGGKIKIESGRNGKSVFVSVQDNGAGIPEEIQAKIFNPFVTTKKDGAGLGLAICQKLCRDNGAILEYKNSSSESVFTLRMNKKTDNPDSMKLNAVKTIFID